MGCAAGLGAAPLCCYGTAGLRAALLLRSPGNSPSAPPNRCCSMSGPVRDAKTQLHASQGPDLQRPDLQHPVAEGDASPAAELRRKSKKRKSACNAQPRKKVPSRDALGRLPRLRPLYQYINLSTELMCPAAEEGGGSAPAEAPTCPLPLYDSSTKVVSQFRDNSFESDPEPARMKSD